jgi:hypothetical protein
MTWLYNDEPFDPESAPEDCAGFVYRITNLDTDMKYIGKKSMWSKRTLPPLKGQKRKRKKVFESDWREYYGSSANLNEERARIGDDRYKREILRFCKSKGELSYYELKYQMDEDVLLKPDEYYNAFVGGKIHRSHVLKS